MYSIIDLSDIETDSSQSFRSLQVTFFSEQTIVRMASRRMNGISAQA